MGLARLVATHKHRILTKVIKEEQVLTRSLEAHYCSWNLALGKEVSPAVVYWAWAKQVCVVFLETEQDFGVSSRCVIFGLDYW